MSSDAAAPRTLAVTAVHYAGKNKPGDYKWMVKQSQYARTIFIVMENFLDMLGDDQGAGGGTACLRPFTYRGTGEDEGKVRAVGIPSGWSTETQGFRQLDLHYSKMAIDLAVERLVLILQNIPTIDTIVYSCDTDDSSLVGTNIFKDSIGRDVVDYISRLLRSVPGRVGNSKFTHERITSLELRLYMYALAVHDAAKLRAENARLKSKLTGPTNKAPGSGSITRFGQGSLLRVPREAPSPAASSSAPSKPLSMRVVGSSGPVSKSIFKKQPWLK